MSAVLKILILLAAALSQPVLAGSKPDISDVLPHGESIASVMGFVADQRSEQISEKMALAAKENRVWLRSYLAENSRLKPGQVLPYHQNLGVSEEEYKYFIDHAVKSGRMAEIGKVAVTSTDSNGKYEINLGFKNSIFKVVRVDVRKKTIVTSLGELSGPKYVAPKQKDSLIGKWGGYSWHLEEGDPMSEQGDAKRIDVTFGIIQESGIKYIYYRANAIADGQSTAAEEMYLFVDDAHNNSLQARRP